MKRWLLILLLLCALPALGQTLSGSGSLTAAAASCTQSNTACAILPLVNETANSTSSTVISLTGTWVATVQFEASPDNGTTWASAFGTPLAGGAAVSSATANGIWTFNVGAFTQLRARVSAFTSGTILVNMQASTAPAPAAAIAAGSTAPTNITQINGASVNTDPCLSSGIAKSNAFANITTATTTALVAVSGTTQVFVCSIMLTMTGSTVAADTLLFEQGTGATCAGAPTAISATYSTGIEASVLPFWMGLAGNGSVLKTAASNGLCVVSTVATTAPAIGVTISYVQQ